LVPAKSRNHAFLVGCVASCIFSIILVVQRLPDIENMAAQRTLAREEDDAVEAAEWISRNMPENSVLMGVDGRNPWDVALLSNRPVGDVRLDVGTIAPEFEPPRLLMLRSFVIEGVNFGPEMNNFLRDPAMVLFKTFNRRNPSEVIAIYRWSSNTSVAGIQTGEGPGTELLKNPGFENLVNGVPVGWGRTGNPIVDASGTRSLSGEVSVMGRGPDNVFYQIVRVKGNTSYRLRLNARADEAGQKTRLYVYWSDAGGTNVGLNLDVTDVTTAWSAYETLLQSPPSATNAAIAASPETQSVVWYDDLSFIEVE
jgi:hypothetical protein